MKRGLSALVSLGLAAALGLSAAAAPLAEVVSQETEQVNGITWSQMTAKVENEDTVLYTVEADAAAFEFAVATHGSKADTIGNMAHILSIKGYAEFFKCDLNASGDDDLDDYLRLHDLTCVIFCL